MPVAPSSRVPARSPASCLVAPAALAAAFASLVAAAPLAAQTAPRTFSVATPAELRTALHAARPGDTVLLAPGNYGTFYFDRFRYTGGYVNVRSADPANRARFGQVFVRWSSGLSISGIDAQTSSSPVVSISASNIRFAGNRIRGANPNGDPWDDNGSGMWIRSSSNVMVASNDFQDLRVAVWIQRSTSVALRHNDFTILREGVNVSGATRGDIANNRFENFSPNYGNGEHPDGIQFWNRNETSGVSHYKVRNNLLSFGNNGAIHGLFLSNEADHLPHSNLEITGNIYYGSAVHGITFDVVNDSVISNNVVAASAWADINNTSFRSADGREGGGFQPSIRYGLGTGVVVNNNIATHFSGNSTGKTSFDNINMWDSHTRSGEAWTTALAGRPSGRNPAIADFVTVSPSVAATRGIGILAPFRVGVVTLNPAAAEAFAAAQQLP
jgi:hypothetical protein